MKGPARKASRVPEDSAADEGNWLVNEIEYWEGAFDRLRGEFLDAVKEGGVWKKSHDDAASRVGEWEGWYKSLEEERELYKKWNAEKASEINRLNETCRRWQEAHDRATETLRRWESWYGSLEKDRDLYKGWNAEKALEMERLSNVCRRWEDAHKHLTELVTQWESWYKSLAEERDKYRLWDEQKREELQRKDDEIRELRGWIAALYRNPIRYLREMIASFMKSSG